MFIFVFSSAFSEQRCSSRAHNPKSNNTFHWDNCNLDLVPLASTGAGLSNVPAHETPARGKVTLNHRSKSNPHQPHEPGRERLFGSANLKLSMNGK